MNLNTLIEGSSPLRRLAGLFLLMIVCGVAQAGEAPVPKKKAPPVSQSRREIKTEANQVATGLRAADAALSPEELAVAQRVELGRIACELSTVVQIDAVSNAPGYFDVQVKKSKWRMFPVLSRTGAIRIEDPAAGVVWIQLSNKSMLMNQKTGSRIADACVTPAQRAVAGAMALNPPANLLEPLPAASAPVSAERVLPPKDVRPVQ
jgi:hypothetical protein